MKISNIDAFIEWAGPMTEERLDDHEQLGSLALSDAECNCLLDLLEAKRKVVGRELAKDELRPSTRKRMRVERDIIKGLIERLKALQVLDCPERDIEKEK